MKLQNKLKFEFLWIGITLVVIIMTMLPIYLSIKEDYPFYLRNILLIVIAITFGRYIFFLKHHWICYSKWFKLFFFFFSVPVFIFLMDSYYEIQSFFDDRGIHSVMDHLHISQQNQLSTYIKTETIFFWAAAFMTNFLLPFKMIRSIWRKKNKGID